ncbi:MAG: hypothetical protein SNG27_00345 [Rikenellaceae bacterium]
MQVSVKKKSSTGVEPNYTDVAVALPELVKRTPPQQPQPSQKITEVEEPKVVEKVVEEPKKVEVATPKKIVPKRPSILNLGALLSQDDAKVDMVASGKESVEESNVDPLAEQKVMRAKGAILEFLNQWRPRFIAVFEPMAFRENAIYIVVPTPELRDEIERNKTEFLTRVIEIAGVKGTIGLEVEVNEAEQSRKPIKLEDRIAFIMELNPLIVDLREALDLDVEG